VTEERESAAVAVNGADIRRRRKLRGWTVTHLALRCGISQQYLSFIERGDRDRVSPPVFARLCDELGVENRSELMLPEGGTAA
jgi:transcriptional regulator with XRE-family HTH domain